MDYGAPQVVEEDVSDLAASRFPGIPLSSETADSIRVSDRQLSGQAESSDEVLLAKVCAGDRDSLAVLFRRYAQPVRNVGRRILRDKAEAEDLVQEVFLYIYRKSALFDSSKGSASSWIIQVSYTQALLRRRRLKSQGFYLSGITDKAVECDHGGDKGGHYDQTVEGLFGRNGWRRMLESLTEDQRQTLRLHFFEGHTFEEIAEKLGQSYGNVRNHHYRGLEKVRKHLADRELNRR